MYVFKALNLFLNKYVAEIQLPGNGIWLLSIHGFALVNNVKNLKNKGGQLHLTVRSLQLSIFAQALGTASPFKLPSQCKTCSLTPFLKLIWIRWQSELELSKSLWGLGTKKE
jgi:hypothetical protein